MKTRKWITLTIGIIIAAMVISCENNDDIIQPEGSILPDKFKVDIPSALSREGAANGRVAVDTLNGNLVYLNLVTFIHIGEGAAEIVEDIIKGITIYGINRPMILSFEGEDDGRTKNLEVIEGAFYDGEDWEFQLTITDAESEGNEDGGKAIQVFWNRSPVKGISILKPYNIDRDSNPELTDAIFRIDYSEAGEMGYDAHMMVQIAELELESPLDNPFSLGALKMFVGKKGDIVDVYGNSDHPNAILFNGEAGFNWAFVAAGKEGSDLGVAEVGLPPSDLDESSREALLGDYSVKNVFTNQILSVWPNLPQSLIDIYLYNTDAPGFFNGSGFVTGGTSPGSEYDEIENRLPELSPYNPIDVSNLDLEFK